MQVIILLLRHSLYGSCEVESEEHASVPSAMNEQIQKNLLETCLWQFAAMGAKRITRTLVKVGEHK